jgi:hypothetical protein
MAVGLGASNGVADPIHMGAVPDIITTSGDSGGGIGRVNGWGAASASRNNTVKT